MGLQADLNGGSLRHDHTGQPIHHGAHDEIDRWQSWMDLAWMREHPSRTALFVRDRFAWKFQSLELLMELQVQLMDMYFKADVQRIRLGIGPTWGRVLPNGINNVLTTVESVRVLVSHGWYGSARMLQRLALETLLVTKHTILNKKAQMKWSSYVETKKPIGIGAEILGNYWPKDRTPLKELWDQWSSVSHATAYAQQPIAIIPQPVEAENIELNLGTPGLDNSGQFEVDVASLEECLDSTMALLSMLNHLLFPKYREATRSVQRTYWEPAWHSRERAIRDLARTTVRDYWRQNGDDPRTLTELWYPAIKQYSSSW